MAGRVPPPQNDIEVALQRVFTSDGAPTDGTEGTFAGVIPVGGLCVDYSNAILYINTNTVASPTYTAVGAQEQPA